MTRYNTPKKASTITARTLWEANSNTSAAKFQYNTAMGDVAAKVPSLGTELHCSRELYFAHIFKANMGWRICISWAHFRFSFVCLILATLAFRISVRPWP
jgi:hypothetical protein